MLSASPRAGRLVQQQAGPDSYAAFLPVPLPPEPPLDLSGQLGGLLERASSSLGRLDGLSRRLGPHRLLHLYVRKEAVLSSQIDGNQSTLPQLLEYENAEATGIPVEDIREVSRYVDAVRFVMEQIDAAIPLSLRLIRDTHNVLMKGGRENYQPPGEFRRTQHWIGGTRPSTARFVPPPPHELMGVLSALELFVAEGSATPIIKAGLAHAQFETIHPFADGNGRLGRLLITMILCAEGSLTRPFLYLSLYFKQHRDAYYAALQRVRTDGDWEGWMAYYLEGVDWAARQTIATTVDLLDLFESNRATISARPESNALTSPASGLSMLAVRSENPLVCRSICANRARCSAGNCISSPVDGRLYLSNAMTAGLPLSRTTWLPKSFVSTPLSQTAMTTGARTCDACRVTSRAAQTSSLCIL